MSRPIFPNESHHKLCRPFSKEEIKDATFSIPNHKTPRPDGFSSGFFKESWEIIAEIVKLVGNIWQTGKFVKCLNHTMLYLIPKNDLLYYALC